MIKTVNTQKEIIEVMEMLMNDKVNFDRANRGGMNSIMFFTNNNYLVEKNKITYKPDVIIIEQKYDMNENTNFLEITVNDDEELIDKILSLKEEM